MKRAIGWVVLALATATYRYGYVKGYEDGSLHMRGVFDAQDRHARRLEARTSAVSRLARSRTP